MHMTTSNGKWLWHESQGCVSVHRVHLVYWWLFLLTVLVLGGDTLLVC